MLPKHPTPDPNATLVVSELFCSLQGEGRLAGRRCGFVRLTGCNLACTWCDTTYTWRNGDLTAADKQVWTLGAILEAVAAWEVELVEVTGGEPLLQSATPQLLTALCDRGHEVILDTSGSLPLTGLDPRARLAMDLKCPASGQSERIDWANLVHLRPERDEVKFVIADRGDYDWARAVCAEHGLFERVAVIFSPVMPAAWRGDFGDWPLARALGVWMLADRCRATLQLQLHRLLWPAAVRGVDEGGES
jgi:7-carboxy-7-deazaguanine synthase